MENYLKINGIDAFEVNAMTNLRNIKALVGNYCYLNNLKTKEVSITLPDGQRIEYKDLDRLKKVATIVFSKAYSGRDTDTILGAEWDEVKGKVKAAYKAPLNINHIAEITTVKKLLK